MSSKFKHVYQFRIAIEGISPEIWRVIQVPENYSFWNLHMAIQDAFGWTNSHLHSFETTNPKTGKGEIIGIPEHTYDEIPIDFVTLPGWEIPIYGYFSEERRSMLYIYDYGDSWNHRIQYEKILFKSTHQKYPVCLDGKREGPPEDCGGIPGYENFLQIINDPLHQEHKEMKRWAGKKKCDTETFDAGKVRFAGLQKQEKGIYS